MYGHLTCPEKLWHVSDKQIGPIFNAGSLVRHGWTERDRNSLHWAGIVK